MRLTASNGTIDDININAGTGITIDQVSPSGLRINAVGGGSGGGATVTTDDNAPSNPVDGDLWWKSNEGRLKFTMLMVVATSGLMHHLHLLLQISH